MSEAARILIVDDDRELRELLLERLKAYEFEPSAVASGAQMFAVLEEDVEGYDLILLDIMLPGEDGLALCRRLRAPGTAYADIPVIFLTALRDTTDRVVGLEIGADDYLPKPFETRELVARIRALLRRVESPRRGTAPTPSEPASESRPLLSFGNWRLNVQARHLLDAQEVVIQLSAAEFRLLTLFLEHPQQVLSRERIMEYMNERQAEIYDRSIDVQISRLRTKLRDNGRNPELIRTMRGDGYMLAVPVQAVDA